MRSFFRVATSMVVIMLMISLISFVSNDYILAGIYVLIILADMAVSKKRNNTVALVFGFFAMVMFEYLFVTTGVETFTRQSLLGVMPIWLPILWAYGFVSIKRAVEIIDKSVK